LIAAGVEGGSKVRIEADWGIADAQAQRDWWKRNGPPLNVAVLIVGSQLGIDWKFSDDPETTAIAPAAPGPTIAELAAITPPPV